MIRSFICRWRFAGVVVLSVLCAASSCEDQPTKPGPAEEYLAYFLDTDDQENWYFIYNPLDNTMDSAFLPYWQFPVVSSDGDCIYIGDFATGETDILETDSFSVIGSLPYGRPIAASPDGKWLAVYEGGLRILSTEDYSEAFYDSSLAGEYFTFAGCFSRSSSAYYGLPKSGNVIRIDLKSGDFDTSLIEVPFGSVFDLEPAPDESKLYLFLQQASGGAFAVLDVGLDSLIFVEALWPGFGSVAVRSDHRLAFYSNPDQFAGPSPGDPWLNVYDVKTNSRIMRISTEGSLPPPLDTLGVPLQQICITPDGKRLVALASQGYPYVFSIDPIDLTIRATWRRTAFSTFGGLACQGSP